LSIAAAVLSSLQTFFGYADRAEKHRVSAARFGAVRRQFENVYAKRDKGIDGKVVEKLCQDLDALAKESLNVPERTFLQVQQSILFCDDEDSDIPEYQNREAHGRTRTGVLESAQTERVNENETLPENI
jgi:hypothetical protein